MDHLCLIARLQKKRSMDLYEFFANTGFWSNIEMI